ncbi:MAG: hypothetical protein U0R76_13465 [Candidatus Nanopelagicales bacterium]
MTLQERRSWTYIVTSVLAYAGYLWWILAHAADPITATAYQKPLLVSIGAAIVVNIVAEIVMSTARPVERKFDVRDKEIQQIGDFTGSSLVVIGAIGGLLLALGEKDFFWISNAIYLGFVLSAILGSMTKIALYRAGMT